MIDENTLEDAAAAAMSLMVDRCVIRRPTGHSDPDPLTHKVTTTYSVVYDPDGPFDGMCKLQTYEAFEQERESAGITQLINRLRVDLPRGSLLVRPNDVVTVLAVASPLADPLLVGQHFRFTVQAPYKSLASAYRVFAELNVGMEVPPWP